MLVGWGVLSPLSKLSGWAPGPVGDMNTGSRGWILWTSLAIMSIDSLVSLTPVVFEVILEAMPQRRSQSSENDHEFEPEDRLVPRAWVVRGVTVSIILGIILVWAVFGSEGIKPWATFAGFVLGGVVSILG